VDINGIWKGEYMTKQFMFETGSETPVPFVLKIKSTGEGRFISLDRGLFEGICQDDPVITKIEQHASIFGSLDLEGIYFVKQYPKLFVQMPTGIQPYDSTHPEIYYVGQFKDDVFSGTWKMNSTFRKINGKLAQLKAMNGLWWMRKV
jgi:hypothetical protein